MDDGWVYVLHTSFVTFYTWATIEYIIRVYWCGTQRTSIQKWDRYWHCFRIQWRYIVHRKKPHDCRNKLLIILVHINNIRDDCFLEWERFSNICNMLAFRSSSRWLVYYWTNSHISTFATNTIQSLDNARSGMLDTNIRTNRRPTIYLGLRESFAAHTYI